MPAGGVLLGFGQSLAFPVGSEAVPGICRICSLPTPCCIFCSGAGEQQKKSIPLKEGNLRGTGSEGPAPHICSTGSAGGGRRPTTIKCDKCHICASRGNDLKLSGTAQLIIILALLLLAGQISISSLSLSWQDLAYLMPRRCIPSPRRSWGVGLLPPRTRPQASKRAFFLIFGSFKAQRGAWSSSVIFVLLTGEGSGRTWWWLERFHHEGLGRMPAGTWGGQVASHGERGGFVFVNPSQEKV